MSEISVVIVDNEDGVCPTIAAFTSRETALYWFKKFQGKVTIAAVEIEDSTELIQLKNEEK
jgi:hypothetical protein